MVQVRRLREYTTDKRKKSNYFQIRIKGRQQGEVKTVEANNPEIGLADRQRKQKTTLLEEIELLDGAAAEFDQELVNKGELSPVFFGSALTNFRRGDLFKAFP